MSDYDYDDQVIEVSISKEVSAIVDRVAAALMRGDSDYACILVQGEVQRQREDAARITAQRIKDHAESENRSDAEFGHGNAEFVTLDGGTFIDRLHLMRGDYYIPEWKRACRPEARGILVSDRVGAFDSVRVRTYEFDGVGRKGLPVYRERHEK